MYHLTAVLVQELTETVNVLCFTDIEMANNTSVENRAPLKLNVYTLRDTELRF